MYIFSLCALVVHMRIYIHLMQQPNTYGNNRIISTNTRTRTVAVAAMATAGASRMRARARHCIYTRCDLSGDICVLFVRMNNNIIFVSTRYESSVHCTKIAYAHAHAGA